MAMPNSGLRNGVEHLRLLEKPRRLTQKIWPGRQVARSQAAGSCPPSARKLRDLCHIQSSELWALTLGVP